MRFNIFHNLKELCIAFLIVCLITNTLFPFLHTSEIHAAAEENIPKSMKNPTPIEVTSDKRTANPGVYWYQLDNGDFRAEFSGRFVDSESTGGICANQFPKLKEVRDQVDFSKWPALEWTHNGNDVYEVEDPKIKEVKYIRNANSYVPGESVEPDIPEQGYIVSIVTLTGYPKTPTYGGDWDPDKRCKKSNVRYDTPMDVYWKGKIYEEKEIDVTPDSILSVGENEQMSAMVFTKDYGMKEWNKKGGIDVAGRVGETKWTSADQTVVTITSAGVVTAIKPGKTFVRAIWKKGAYLITDTAEITVSGEPGLTVKGYKFCLDQSRNPVQLKAYLTKEDGKTHELTAHPKLTWTSSNPSIIRVDNSGKITPVGTPGSATITARFKDASQQLDESGTSTVTAENCGPSPGIGECKAVIDPPSPGSQMVSSSLSPDASGMLRSDVRGAETFRVEDGIPSSESLFANVFGLSYLYAHEWVQMTGEVTYTVPVKKTFMVKPPPPPPPPEGEEGGETEPPPLPQPNPITILVEVKRSYSYWQIDQLEAYGLEDAQVQNYALSGYGGTVTLQPQGYYPPELTVDHSTEVESHVKPQPCEAVDLGEEEVDKMPSQGEMEAEFKPEAEKATKPPLVNNDQVVWNGQTVMDNSEQEETSPTPGLIPSPSMMGQDVLYQSGLIIEPTLANSFREPSSGTIRYRMVPGSLDGQSEMSFPIAGLNDITVHTPVVNDSAVPDDNRPFDQRMVPDWSRPVIILDRPFTLNFDETAQHRPIQGYGYRDYAAYTKEKRVRFPFGVFQNEVYYPADTWIQIPVGTPSIEFKMPTWVDEGDYVIRTESWAINSSGIESCEPNQNANLANYCASQEIPVGVVGRLFQFRVWDIGDFRYEKVFRTAAGSTEHTDWMYYAGGRDENGQPTALEGKPQQLLPIRPGSVPGEAATVPHSGYAFLFDFRTIGNVWDKGEGIRIEPTFWFVPRTGGEPRQVDLYYDASGNGSKMIGVGSARDKMTYTRTYQLADPMRNIPDDELKSTANYEYNFIWDGSQRQEKPWPKFYTEYVKRKTKIGYGYGSEILGYKGRTLIGPTQIPQRVNPTEALRSVQHWYGEYHIPSAPYILPKGTGIERLAARYGGILDGDETEFLKGGYILVNFGLYTLRNSDVETKVLGYKAPIANMWSIEGQLTSASDLWSNSFSFRSGDVIFYESDFSVRNDYEGRGRKE
ncbi:DUF5704 domain-containing protein [Paenibacillus herberti]|uniref:DUF5704 domain-containing protein n=1 Tax=Paenibacillus herberti TaxID=1619309 RepID=A0A229NZW5_9BACL|nr:DUF5704 domain-containing protein [Paenibacillus herberti]OXM15553.1 hypothetical protein CGZ75_02100 [Paenibacillus herberti]